MDILSESNLEIVYADGTILDKSDNIRRPYADHIARFAPQPPQSINTASTPPPVDHPRRLIAVALPASCGVVLGFIGGILAHAIHF